MAVVSHIPHPARERQLFSVAEYTADRPQSRRDDVNGGLESVARGDSRGWIGFLIGWFTRKFAVRAELPQLFTLGASLWSAKTRSERNSAVDGGIGRGIDDCHRGYKWTSESEGNAAYMWPAILWV